MIGVDRRDRRVSTLDLRVTLSPASKTEPYVRVLRRERLPVAELEAEAGGLRRDGEYGPARTEKSTTRFP